MKVSLRHTWLVALALATTRPASALEVGAEGDVASVDIHAFVSQGVILTTDNNYLSSSTKHGSLQFSEAGINFTKKLTDRLRVGVQLFAQNLGPTGNYTAKMDWFYLDYHLADWLGFRAGRVKIPFGLYNELNDIDSARVPILLPQSVYPIDNRNYLLAQTGGELYGYLPSRAAGALEYRLYGGTIFVPATTPPGSPVQIQEVRVPYLAGGRLLWETPLEGLRVGGSIQALRLDLTLLSNSKPVSVEIPAVLAVGSIEYAAHDFLLAAEYSRWHLKANSSDAMLFPPTPAVVSERGYGMASYRATKWLQPGVYYSLLFPDVDHRDGRENKQHDIATTLRFDINAHWLLKLEAHYMIGTAGLSAGLNNNVPTSELGRNWEVFLAKTTVYF